MKKVRFGPVTIIHSMHSSAGPAARKSLETEEASMEFGDLLGGGGSGSDDEDPFAGSRASKSLSRRDPHNDSASGGFEGFGAEASMDFTDDTAAMSDSFGGGFSFGQNSMCSDAMYCSARQMNGSSSLFLDGVSDEFDLGGDDDEDEDEELDRVTALASEQPPHVPTPHPAPVEERPPSPVVFRKQLAEKGRRRSASARFKDVKVSDGGATMKSFFNRRKSLNKLFPW